MMFEPNIVNIATICTILSTGITIFSYIRSTKNFYRIISIIFTLCLIVISIILYSNSKSNLKKETENAVTEFEYLSIDKNVYLSYSDSLDKDSSDIEFLKKYQIVSGMYSNIDKSKELELLIDLSLQKSKYFWAIKYADEIYSNITEAENLKKVINQALQDKNNYKYAIIAASEIFSSTEQEEQLKIIIDSCLVYKKYDEAYIAAELIFSSISGDKYKSIILREMNL